VRIATWNVNGLRARLDFVRHWLDARRPDVVALQELRHHDEVFPRAELEEAGYRALFHGQKGRNGVAVLCRAELGPPKPVCVGLPGREADGARLLSANVAGLLVSSAYVPNGKRADHADFPAKLAWLDALVAHLESRHDPDEALVVAGDFNVVPAALDSWNEEAFRGRIFHTDAERERVQRLLAWGLADVFRELHPDRRAYSWWDYRGGAFHRKQGLRIDLVLATRGVRERARFAAIDREYRKKKQGLTASDHAPVIVDLDEPGAPLDQA